MKNKRPILINPALLWVSLSILLPLRATAADYNRLKAEFDNYTPPAYYRDSLKEESPAAPPSRPLPISPEATDIKKAGEAALQAAAQETNFFDFHDESSSAIRKIALTEKIEGVLQKKITLETLLAAAFERNPELQGARKKWAAALERYGQALALDNIMSQYNAFAKELDTTAGAQRQKQKVALSFPFPGALALKGDIVTKEGAVARENYLITLRDMVSEIKLAYHDLVYLGEALRITEKNLKLLKHLESTAFVKYKTGQAGYSDVIKVQVKISKLDNDLITLKEEHATVTAGLNRLLSLPPRFSLGKPAESPPQDTDLSLEGLIRLGLEEQQEIKRLKLEIERAGLAIELAEKKYYPDLTPGFSYFEDRAKNTLGTAARQEAFSLTLAQKPEFWFGRHDAYIREARLNYQALQKQLLSMEDKLRYRVKEHYFHLDTARRTVALYRDSLLKLAENALQAAETEYLAGKIDFLNVLDAQAVWLEYNLNYHRSLRYQKQSLARLERVIGLALGGRRGPYKKGGDEK